jgi:hypothetical protein
MDDKKTVLVKPQNLERLLKLLIVDGDRKKKSVMDDHEVELRARHYHKLIGAFGDQGEIIDAIQNSMAEICATGMDKDSRLVADLLVSCSLAYPDKKGLVIEGLEGCGTYIANAGEGVAIALLEIVNSGDSTAFEEQMFEVFSAGLITSALVDSEPTPAGSGRLTTAIESFIGPIWHMSGLMTKRRFRLRTLLSRWNRVLAGHSMSRSGGILVAPTLGLFLKINVQYRPTFLEKFADELTQRYFMRATLGFRFHAIDTLSVADGMSF